MKSWLILSILAVLTLYFFSQSLIGSLTPPVCGIGDRLQNWTAGINDYLQTHTRAANALIITYSAIGDAVVLFLLFSSLWQSSIRPILPLFLFLVLRQFLQILVSFPLGPGLIWHYPGFYSLFSTYTISSDFYFSAYVGINLLGNLELERYRITWLSALGLSFLVFVAFIDIVLRSHYTADLYTSIIVAFFSYLAVQRLVVPVDQILKKIKRISPYLLIVLIAFGTTAYYTTEYFIGKKTIPHCAITDQLQYLLYPINVFLTEHSTLANAQLIVINTVVDVLCIFILIKTVVTRDIRPFFTLLLFFFLRQILQLCVSLPVPPHTIWHYPGFPSLLLTYNISNDLYFSGHTGVSLIAAIELALFRKKWLTILGIGLFAYEVISVIAMQVHYTMDVFTAMMTVWCITCFARRYAPYLNCILKK